LFRDSSVNDSQGRVFIWTSPKFCFETLTFSRPFLNPSDGRDDWNLADKEDCFIVDELDLSFFVLREDGFGM
jgi:hypothetical protein